MPLACRNHKQGIECVRISKEGQTEYLYEAWTAKDLLELESWTLPARFELSDKFVSPRHCWDCFREDPSATFKNGYIIPNFSAKEYD